MQVESRLGELQNTLDAGIHHRNNVFENIGHNLEQWTVMVSQISGDSLMIMVLIWTARWTE